MLNSIFVVTICAENLDAVESAYSQYLFFKTIERGRVSVDLARLWSAPRMADREYLLLQSESEAPVYLRFIQSASDSAFNPLRTTGWNAIEILVGSPDRLRPNLAKSPFEIVGEPRGLSFNANIRAMQVLGPARELLYLTSVPETERSLGLGTARTEVDRIFIAVAGTRNLEAMQEFYRSVLRMDPTPPLKGRISSLSLAYGLDPEYLHNLSTIQMPGQCLIELDEYPPEATERVAHPGELPPVISIVTFNTDSLGQFAPAAIPLPEKPYEGRRAALIRGAAGELIELVES